ncbi:MAG: hypothetical protein Kow0013_09080 [Pararhodobacter sp.]
MRVLRIRIALTSGAGVMRPVASDFLALQPWFALHIAMTDTLVDLSALAYDLAIRVSEPKEIGATLHRRIDRIGRRLMAAPNAPDLAISDPSFLKPA